MKGLICYCFEYTADDIQLVFDLAAGIGNFVFRSGATTSRSIKSSFNFPFDGLSVNYSIRGIPGGVVHVKGFLVGVVDTGRCDQCYFRFGQWLFYR